MEVENSGLNISTPLQHEVCVSCTKRKGRRQASPRYILHFYLISDPPPKLMDTLENLCLQAIGAYISQLFKRLYEMKTRKELLSTVTQQLQMITQSIPPLLANNFTSIVLKTLTRHTFFIQEELHLDLHKKFLSVVLHPSVTCLHLPFMPADCDEYVYNKLFGTAVTKVEVLRIEHCCSGTINGFGNLPHLHTIIFHSFCTDYFLENLQQCCGHRLRKLDVANSDSVTAQSIMTLHKFQCLEELNITRTGIKDGNFQRLAYGFAGGTLPASLKTISCGNMTVSDLNVLAEGNFPNLRELCVEKLMPNKPIDKNIGNIKSLVLSFSALTHDLLSMVGVTLTELHLIRVTNLDATILMSQCPNLSHLEVKMCRHVVMVYEDVFPKETMNTEWNSLKHLHLDTYYLLADMIFIQYGRNIEHLTVIAERPEDKETNVFVRVLTEVSQKLISISFRSVSHDGLLPTNVVDKLIHLCPRIELIEGMLSSEEASRLQKLNPSIKFIS